MNFALLALLAPAPVDIGPAQTAAPTAIVAEAGEFDNVETVPDEELAEYRGGFTWQGVEIGLGAEVRTYVNGDLALQTNISWLPSGAHTTQWVSDTLTPADASRIQAGILSSGGITMRVGDQQVFLANEGQTAILHRTDGAIQSVLLNTASNVSLTQQIDANLDLQNFGQFQQDFMDHRIADGMADQLGQMTTNSLGR